MELNWAEIDTLARSYHCIDPVSSVEALTRQLRMWWCVKFSRPMKDPLLDTYTLQELALEYLIHFYMNPDNDPNEKKRKESQEQSDFEWAKEQLKKIQPEKSKKIQDSEKAPEPSPIPNLPEISTSFDK